MSYNQLIISIGREFGSGGHEIGQKVAEKLNIKFYDRNLLDEMAEERHMSADEYAKFDEKQPFISRTVRGFSSSLSENLARMQFEYLRQKAQGGESFVIVGRCADAVLIDFPLISAFILAEEDFKIERVKGYLDCDDFEARTAMRKTDRSRKLFHNEYSDIKWAIRGHMIFA